MVVNLESDRKPNLDKEAESLVQSATSWMDDALRCWASGNHTKVGLLAPLAVEHLSKAVLWSANPVLLVPLDQNDEASLWALAGSPSLGSKSLRTVGLKVALDRAEKVLGGAPVLVKAHKSRMVSVRNGVTHVGSADLSRHVLLDAIKIANALIDHLGISQAAFYGTHAANVAALIDRKRTDTGHAVLEKRARARQRVEQLQRSLGGAAFEEAVWRLEAQREELSAPATLGYEIEAIDHECPECRYTGRLFGTIELEDQVDFDTEPLGGGEYEAIVVPYWEIWFSPQAFECAVCHLALPSPDELAEGQIDVRRRIVASEDLGVEFDLDAVVGNEFAAGSY